MLRHVDIWRAIDLLAERHGFSPSGLARRAGLDPTAFNRSKRVARDGRPRWPTTESIAKILEATGASVTELVAAITAGDEPAMPFHRRIPVVGLAKAGIAGYFDDSGRPAGQSWDHLAFPDLGDPHLYAIEIAGDGLAPVCRPGDTIIVSPTANPRRGDRVVVKTTSGEVLARQLVRRNAWRVELLPLDLRGAPRALAGDEVVFIHRIVWIIP